MSILFILFYFDNIFCKGFGYGVDLEECLFCDGSVWIDDGFFVIFGE